MSASSSLSRIELALHSGANDSASASGGASSSSSSSSGLSALVSGWRNATAASASTSATNAANSLSTSASAAAAKVQHSASAWFGALSAKVQGKEYAPVAQQDVEMGNVGDGSKAIPSSDPGGPSGVTSGLGAQLSSEVSSLTSLGWKNRMVACMACAAVGTLMLFMSFSFVPLVLVGAPTKFALSYSMANLFLLAASGFLAGFSQMASQLFTPERAVSSLFYFSTLLLTFYVCFAAFNFLVVLPVLIAQFAALLWLTLSYVPFSQGAMKRICSWTIGRQFSSLSS